MPGESWLVAGLILVAAALMGVVMVLSFSTAPLPGARQALGVLVRLACPTTGAPTQVRVGKDPRSGDLAVLWCERFPEGTITCDRACFTAIGEPAAQLIGSQS
jgi:hypothetical protein